MTRSCEGSQMHGSIGVSFKKKVVAGNEEIVILASIAILSPSLSTNPNATRVERTFILQAFKK